MQNTIKKSYVIRRLRVIKSIFFAPRVIRIFVLARRDATRRDVISPRMHVCYVYELDEIIRYYRRNYALTLRMMSMMLMLISVSSNCNLQCFTSMHFYKGNVTFFLFLFLRWLLMFRYDNKFDKQQFIA